jgi:hypothetical protein
VSRLADGSSLRRTMAALEGFSILSRRRVLKVLLGAGGAVAAGAGGLFALRGSAPAVDGLSILTAHEFRTLKALAQAVIPQGGAFAFGADDVDLARAFDGFLATEPPWNQGDLKSALFLLEFGPVFFERRFVTFSHLSLEERAKHFSAWMNSDTELRRVVATAFRRFLLLVFYDTPQTWPPIGYPGPSLTAGAAP